MVDLSLFSRDQLIGIFRGFSEGGLEFHADLVLPYQARFQSIPMHGQFLLIQLADENEAVLGRITSAFSDGRLASGSGEDYGIRVVKEGREVPDDLREQYLKYRVNVRVLGVVRKDGDKLLFAASHRRLPHVGSKVAFLSDAVLREIAGHNVAGAELGFFALGEFIYANLYKGKPSVTKRNGRQVPVGTVIFDPDGEYFWPDDKNRPALCDVPELRDQIVVFTRRDGPSPYYQSFVAGSIKLDIRRLRPGDVVSIALSPEKQDQQNVRKLKSLHQQAWERLVNEIDAHGNQTDLQFIRDMLHLDVQSDAEAIAARSNMTQIVRMLHDRGSQMLDMLITALRTGKLCVVDVSQLRGTSALVLSGIILQKIFDTNQDEFTKAEPQTIPTIAVVEEAQSVLGSSGSSGEGPYVTWVKEGRKYDLGAVLITQQPGSISGEILSQGDNWFIFHLLAAGDLQAVRKANAHFSEDLLSALLNEPIQGHGVFWSSAGGRPYPVPVRALSFEHSTELQDKTYSKPAVDCYASRLRTEFAKTLEAAEAARPVAAEQVAKAQPESAEDGESVDETPVDAMELYRQQALAAVVKDDAFLRKLRSEKGLPWKGVSVALEEKLPTQLQDRGQIAYDLVRPVLDAVFGAGRWESYKQAKKDGSGNQVTWVRAKA